MQAAENFWAGQAAEDFQVEEHEELAPAGDDDGGGDGGGGGVV